MKIKGIDRTANVAWSPQHQYPIYLAAGTAAQQLDASFSTSAALEVYSLNLNDPGNDLALKATVQSEQRFHKLTWGNYGQNSGAIVGGCDNGVIQIYNATKLLNGENGLVSQQSKHKGPVKALDFNSFQSNLLASGASESEIFIWDLNNTNTPMTPGSKSQPPEDITSIAWNKQVQHILASSFPTKCVVWDLRKNDPIIKLSDSASRIRWNVVAWNPEIATQLCLGSEEDQNPVIQLWDLRFATSPLKILENHQRGVLSVSWCHQDTDMLLSCGKDNRILCWNPNSTSPDAEVICEIMSSNQWNFDVSWCPRNPALFVCSSFDGHVSIYSVVGGPQQVQTSNKIADSFPGMELYTKAPVPQTHAVPVELRKPPKWLRKPVGATFGFGGKLVTFGNYPNTNNERQQRSIYISQVVTEPQLVSRSSQLESALQNGDYAEFCRSKIAQSNSSHEKSIWQFLSAYFEPSPRTEFLSLLGFKNEDLNGKLGKFVGKPANARDNDIHQLTDRMTTLGRSTDSESELEGVEDFNDQQRSFLGPDGLEAGTDLSATAAFDAISASQTPSGFKISTGDDIDGLICQALLLGNTEAAVELCLQDNRMADAIILAMTGGSELLAKTQYRYFQQSSGYLSTLISAVVTEDWTQVIRNCDIDSWKEALAAAITHTNEQEFPILCELLGERLENEKNGALASSAQLCYICAGNLSKLVSSWLKPDKISSPNCLQDLVELVMILKKAVELQGADVEISGRLADILSNYASMLASQGSMEAALSYLGASNEEKVVELRDRLNWSLGRNEVVRQHQQPMQRRLSSQSITQRTRTLSSGMYPPQQIHEEPLPPPPTVQQNFNLNPMQSNQPLASGYPQSSFIQAPPAPVPAPAPVPQVPPPSRGYSSPSPGLTGGGVTSRTKHVLDPSVSSTAHSFNNQPYYPQNQYQSPAYSQPLQQNQPFNLNPTGGYPPEVFNPPVNPTPPPPPPPSIPNPANNFQTQPPGWNDPPVVGGGRNIPRGECEMSAQHAGTRKWNSVISHQQPKQEFVQQAPITHPLFGAAPPEAPMNGQHYDPYHQSQPPQFSPQQQQQQPPPSQPYLPPQSFPNQQQHQQSYQQFHPPQNNYSNSVTTPPVKQVQPEPVKKPIPEEHVVLQTVFDELRNRCTGAANNPQSRRKLEEVSKKLEALYDSLRDNKLSSNTLQGLHVIAQHVQAGDYTNGLMLHTQLVSGPDFSQIASFMPGIKVLLQSALQLQVYL